jgi:SEC-C motif-containing protein
MRSRYAAYAKGEVDYVIETTDPDGEAWEEPESKWRADIRKFGRDVDFLGVDIIDSGVEEDAGWVRFHARLRSNGANASFTERSEFVRRDGKWFYSRGEVEVDGVSG